MSSDASPNRMIDFEHDDIAQSVGLCEAVCS